MGDTRKFDEIFIRLLGLGFQSQKEVASVLGISTSVVSRARKENRFPKKWVSKLCQNLYITPEVLLGIESKFSIFDLFMLIFEDEKRISALEADNHLLHQRIKVLKQEMGKHESVIKRPPLKIVGKKATPPLSE